MGLGALTEAAGIPSGLNWKPLESFTEKSEDELLWVEDHFSHG